MNLYDGVGEGAKALFNSGILTAKNTNKNMGFFCHKIVRKTTNSKAILPKKIGAGFFLVSKGTSSQP